MAFFNKESQGSPVPQNGKSLDDGKKRKWLGDGQCVILCSCEGCSEPADMEISGKDICNFHFATDFPDLMTKELAANEDLVTLAKAYDATKNEHLREMIFSEFRKRIEVRRLHVYRFLNANGAPDWKELPLPRPRSEFEQTPWAFVPPFPYLQALLCDRIDGAVAISRAKKGKAPVMSQQQKAQIQFEQLVGRLTRHRPAANLEEPPFDPDEYEF